ncbi:MAG: ABC transporter ATP-binding protein [Phycisphaerae bacterium]|jgi:putative ABC transport system ATP-binding protein
MGALSIRDLVFAYPRRDENPFELRVSSLVVQAGEQVLLTAGSGTGKSTLLNLIAGLMEPQSGVIEVAGQNVHGLRGAARDLFRGRSIGVVFQTFHLLQGFTAMENVMSAMLMADKPAGEMQPRAKELLAELGITKPLAMVEELSVGQQQRVAVARALACKPALVLADEPTASLDPSNAAAAMDLLQNLCTQQNAALLCVSHDPAMAARFSRRVSMEELSAGGTPAPQATTQGGTR